MIFRGEYCLDEQSRYLVDVSQDAFLLAEFGDQLAVGGVHTHRHLQLGIGQILHCEKRQCY